LRTLQPILTGELFGEVRRELLSLLKSLGDEEWKRPTAAAKWNVKDVALHILGGDVGNISRRRDAFSLKADLSSHEKLVAFINEINASWVEAGQRVSAPLLIDLLDHVGRQADEYFAGLDPFAMGGPVDWAGTKPMPVWFDVAREYTERWHHQQQIRVAVERPGISSRELYFPVLDTFMRGMPHAFRSVDAREGTMVEIQIVGEAGSSWFVEKVEAGWRLGEQPPSADATLKIDQELAWRVFTKAIDAQTAAREVEMSGDRPLAIQALSLVAVLA